MHIASRQAMARLLHPPPYIPIQHHNQRIPAHGQRLPKDPLSAPHLTRVAVNLILSAGKDVYIGECAGDNAGR